MVRYEFYGDAHILGLRVEDGAEVFIDVQDLSQPGDLLVEEDGISRVQVYVDPAEVRDLFGSHGCLGQCPLGDGSDSE